MIHKIRHQWTLFLYKFTIDDYNIYVSVSITRNAEPGSIISSLSLYKNDKSRN